MTLIHPMKSDREQLRGDDVDDRSIVVGWGVASSSAATLHLRMGFTGEGDPEPV